MASSAVAVVVPVVVRGGEVVAPGLVVVPAGFDCVVAGGVVGLAVGAGRGVVVGLAAVGGFGAGGCGVAAGGGGAIDGGVPAPKAQPSTVPGAGLREPAPAVL
ncbi:hypothetical protein ACFQV2_18825 [Actinokineospora soli]|uniref:Uncharacterized protein n=1 Tax=Actinokineospora soli TaxID=1048753 RepID=A0ABW2TQ02_9PSEU